MSMQRLLLAAAAAGLCLASAGCGTLDGKLENVLARSITGDRLFGNSMWGPIGIVSEFRAADAAEINRLLRQAAAAQARDAQAAPGKPASAGKD